MANPFFRKSLISVEQLTHPQAIEFLFKLADQMEKRVKRKIAGQELKDSTLAILFFQPSTRTFTSFSAAAQWLGNQRLIALPGMGAYSSTIKGESLPDTIKTIEQTVSADLIILRHPDDNSCQIAAHAAHVPIINAGSGKKEHPTQALLDLYTIKKKRKTLDHLKIIMLGDLRNGRTIKSLSKLLALTAKDVEIFFISPPQLRAPRHLIRQLKKKGVKIREDKHLETFLPQADVLYVTRIQKEWFPSQEEYLKLKGSYKITPATLKKASSQMILMHPLPRVDEIDIRCDHDPRAVYFEQVRNGLYIRMALLASILGKI